ncbi:MAG TPA: hypothetical protein VFA28_18965 [Bryobacteraceae bacterium]|nr:hypothetical protein [Bryobacteraceae bacterium]
MLRLFPPPNQEQLNQEQLDFIGAEPLEGSGFEDEQPEDGFDDGGEDGND